MLSVAITSDREVAPVATSTVGPAALRRALVGDRVPDVLVLECRGVTSDATALVAALHDALPEVRLLVVTPDDDGARGLGCLRSGAAAVVPRSTVDDGLLRALDRVADGRLEVGPATAHALLRATRRAAPSRVLANLTPTQERILSLMATGATNRTIADRLGVAEKTVKNYATAIYSAMGAANRAEAVALWTAAGREEAAHR